MSLLHNLLVIAAIATSLAFSLPSVHKTQAKNDGMPQGTWTKAQEDELRAKNPPISAADLGKHKR